MVLLIHHPVSPFSRKVRIAMSEKRMLFVLKEEEPWRLSQDVYKLNPAGELPVYVYDGNVISGNYAICEFLEEVSKDYKLLPAEIQARAEVRRLTEWFDVIAKFTATWLLKRFTSVSAKGWHRIPACLKWD